MITISKSLFATSAAFLHVYVMIFDISSLFSWQSVLVTIDRHEWYASPQIYTRDDNSGLWIGKQALPDVNKPLVNGVQIWKQVVKVNHMLKMNPSVELRKGKLWKRYLLIIL